MLVFSLKVFMMPTGCGQEGYNKADNPLAKIPWIEKKL